ncbi:hypothetical protein JS520_00120 [Candidatus Vidania fulgoroideae]|nr:hypothetical protein JS520_00120 [Candidatus Vidania fulgoroideae]
MIQVFIKDQPTLHSNVIMGVLQYNNKRLPILIEKYIETQLLKHKAIVKIQLGNIYLYTYIENYERQIFNNQLKHIILTSSYKTRKYVIKIQYSNYEKSELFKNKKKTLYNNIKTLAITSPKTTHVPSYIRLNTLKIKTSLKIKHLQTIIPCILNFKKIKNTPLFTF